MKYQSEDELFKRASWFIHLGASSTSGKNIQLNLEDSFQNIYSDCHYDFETGLLRIGVSYSILQFTTILRHMNMFLPHGQCLDVHLGGHLQTGGYGMIVRAFGLLSDHIEGIEMVMADGELKTIWIPQASSSSNG